MPPHPIFPSLRPTPTPTTHSYQLTVYCVCGTLLYILISSNEHSMAAIASGGDSPIFWTVFHVISAYCQAGFALLPDSFRQFRECQAVLLCISILVVAGNVMFPIFLRWIIIALNHHMKHGTTYKVAYKYLLLNPRRVYTSLFESTQTWVLLITQLLLMLLQVVTDSSAKAGPAPRTPIYTHVRRGGCKVPLLPPTPHPT